MLKKRPAVGAQGGPTKKRKRVTWADQQPGVEPALERSVEGPRPVEDPAAATAPVAQEPSHSRAQLSPELQDVVSVAESLTQPFDQIVVCMPTDVHAFVGKHSLVCALDKQQFP